MPKKTPITMTFRCEQIDDSLASTQPAPAAPAAPAAGATKETGGKDANLTAEEDEKRKQEAAVLAAAGQPPVIVGETVVENLATEAAVAGQPLSVEKQDNADEVARLAAVEEENQLLEAGPLAPAPAAAGLPVSAGEQANAEEDAMLAPSTSLVQQLAKQTWKGANVTTDAAGAETPPKYSEQDPGAPPRQYQGDIRESGQFQGEEGPVTSGLEGGGKRSRKRYKKRKRTNRRYNRKRTSRKQNKSRRNKNRNSRKNYKR